MEILRVKNAVDFLGLKSALIPMFEKYSARVHDHNIVVDEMFKNDFTHILFPVCYVVGFL
jgi:hypothetical protein